MYVFCFIYNFYIYLGLDHSSVEWQTTDIEVIIRDTHEDDGLSGQTGIIRGISVSIYFHFLSSQEHNLFFLI